MPAGRSHARALANESEMYGGPALNGEIKAYRGADAPPSRGTKTRSPAKPASGGRSREAARPSRGTASRAKRPASPSPSPVRRSRRVAPAAESHYDETRRQSLHAYGATPPVSRPDAATTQVESARRAPASRTASSRRPPVSRSVASSGGAAALTVGRAMADVARPAAAAARPMLNLVAGGLEKLPTGTVAQPAARGRILIVIVGLLAAGLIYISVGKLEAGDGYGRYSQRAQELQRENTILRARIAGLDSAERIVKFAKNKLNMVMPQPEQFEYLHTRHGDAVRAMRNYTAPTTAPAPSPQQQVAPVTTSPTDTGGTQQPAAGTTPTTAPQIPVTAPNTGAPTPVAPGSNSQGNATPGAGQPGATNGNAGATAPGGH